MGGSKGGQEYKSLISILRDKLFAFFTQSLSTSETGLVGRRSKTWDKTSGGFEIFVPELVRRGLPPGRPGLEDVKSSRALGPPEKETSVPGGR